MWINLQIVISIVLVPISVLLGNGESMPMLATYFFAVVVFGIFTLMVSIKLKPVAGQYPHLGTYRIWLMVESILMISVILIVFAVVASLVTSVLQALMLQHASRERRDEDSQLI